MRLFIIYKYILNSITTTGRCATFGSVLHANASYIVQISCTCTLAVARFDSRQMTQVSVWIEHWVEGYDNLKCYEQKSRARTQDAVLEWIDKRKFNTTNKPFDNLCSNMSDVSRRSYSVQYIFVLASCLSYFQRWRTGEKLRTILHTFSTLKKKKIRSSNLC